MDDATLRWDLQARLMSTGSRVVLDDIRNGRTFEFSSPLRTIVAHDPTEVPGALSMMQRALDVGHHLAGYLSYELGYVLEPRLTRLLPEDRVAPLLWFGEFDEPPERIDRAGAAALWPDERVYASPLRFEWDYTNYRTRFDAVMESIRAGDVYEANLTMRGQFRLSGDPEALYGRLRCGADVAYGAFVDDGCRQLLSLSPELFFKIDRSGTITTRPMKGTAPRGMDADTDRLLRDRLHIDPKQRAENLMIVDLLRNDLGKFALGGSVNVHELFTVETYPTVHQMTSTVCATVPTGLAIHTILRALFPCGSITGAPKIRAMELIRELEASPRGVYCGAIGELAPDGSAFFNVAIRTLAISGHEGELRVGGAVVADSTADGEYAECLLKARFFEGRRRHIALLETMGYAGGTWPRRQRHLQRMGESARALGIPFDPVKAAITLDDAVASCAGPRQRVRLRLREDGTLDAEASDMPMHVEPLKFVIAPRNVHSADPLNRHKTDWRDTYREVLAWAKAEGADEAILLNERGEVSEGTYTNVFIEREGRILTPPLSSGALPGCLRSELIESGRCEEAVLTPADLRVGGVFLGNSLRGLMRACT